jgi:precorrin-6B methylase 1
MPGPLTSRYLDALEAVARKMEAIALAQAELAELHRDRVALIEAAETAGTALVQSGDLSDQPDELEQALIAAHMQRTAVACQRLITAREAETNTLAEDLHRG